MSFIIALICFGAAFICFGRASFYDDPKFAIISIGLSVAGFVIGVWL